ncbi:sulfotransferase 1C2 [Anolis carolinensis]|uniref:Sulfotransferase n=1 Tax=Anolis carolinensis TaxID=28377 RepID=H9GVY5_ANOCA|nr:PREDICTED: sulfotransferase 1C2 [Anolis carolinensis]XP_016851663.1 PREDICTED: sulfotransferase 1C2 [Anolis carolinensis]|eukprot:XP_003225295.1 PREDICTED: sulfotransferase 1C2 [Anolis carolinensis]
MDPELPGDESWLVKTEGVPLPRQTTEKWDQISAFQARPDDLLICTFPKSGTSWIQEIVDIILHGGDLQKCDQLPIYERSPFIELFLPKPVVSGVDEAEAMPSPRVLKTHLPAPLLPPSFWKQNCKMIYLARNVKDNAVSTFNFHRMNKLLPNPGDWNNFLEDFIAGRCWYGSWFDHVCGWWEAKNHHPILYLFYEDMKENPAQEIRKVAEFLRFELSELVLSQIVQHTAFKSMKANEMTNFTTLPSSILDHSVSSYMRKGTVGDWKKHFTVAQSEWLDTICAQKLKNGPSFRTQL